MATTHELAKRFREVVLDGTFIANTNYKHQLVEVNWQVATTNYGSLNTIAALAQHVHYYINGIKTVLQGGNLEINDKYSFDFPEIKSQNEWESFLFKFWKDAEEFALLVEQLPEEKLKAIFVDQKYGNYQRNIDAMIEHSYYHLGQIVLLKKILSTGN